MTDFEILSARYARRVSILEGIIARAQELSKHKVETILDLESQNRVLRRKCKALELLCQIRKMKGVPGSVKSPALENVAQGGSPES